jgi:hypothetical protein
MNGVIAKPTATVMIVPPVLASVLRTTRACDPSDAEGVRALRR